MPKSNIDMRPVNGLNLVLQLKLLQILPMKLSEQIKPISYLKAHAAEVVRNLAKSEEPVVITQNGAAKAVLQDIRSYEKTQESLALLKILALGQRQIEAGNIQTASDAVKAIRNKAKSSQ